MGFRQTKKFFALTGTATLALSIWKLLRKSEGNLQLLNAGVDTGICNWRLKQQRPSVYVNDPRGLTDSPIFSFDFFNPTAHVVSLSRINVKIKFFEAGMNGIPIPPKAVAKSAPYSFDIQHGKELYSFELGKFFLKPNSAANIKLELLLPNDSPLKDRYGIYFDFHFGNSHKLSAPVILLNSDNEDGLLTYYGLH